MMWELEDPELAAFKTVLHRMQQRKQVEGELRQPNVMLQRTEAEISVAQSAKHHRAQSDARQAMQGFDYEHGTLDPAFSRCRSASQRVFRGTAFEHNPLEFMSRKSAEEEETAVDVACKLHYRVRAYADAFAWEAQCLQEEADSLRIADVECVRVLGSGRDRVDDLPPSSSSPASPLQISHVAHGRRVRGWASAYDVPHRSWRLLGNGLFARWPARRG